MSVDGMQAAVSLSLGIGALAAYGVACWTWPWTSCGYCSGKGKQRSPSGKRWRKCPRCKGSGERYRTGYLILRKLRGRP